ncbi:dCTP deaminase [Rhizobium leguminosarum]|uniref:dCTP deaminase n=1 Tax=Rhizobium leguminosarum TaxID=384 RepID=UPI001C9734C4|nr:dCTP deaminase [Rhizobium leguminosarum]MBY5533633.1 dCTP deaminase [Rhizobium leguminosarum]
MLDCKRLATRINAGSDAHPDGLAIIPEPDLKEIENSGEASVTLRLGRWFIALKQSSQSHFDVAETNEAKKGEARAARKYFVPFGGEFTLHPGRFVLSSTLEWMKFPATLGGYVTGKSTWARRGLIIETAAGVHPGFAGCLTLELTNVGEVPIILRPGMKICQIFVHGVEGGEKTSSGGLTGRRRPHLGSPRPDKILQALSTKAE